MSEQTKPIPVKFIENDPAGLWREGDLADDLGWESDHPEAPPILLLKLRSTGETISLTDPYGNGIIEEVDDL